LTKEISLTFNELGIFKALRHANIYKSHGVEANLFLPLSFL
jgi:hypothetical protein